MTDSPRSSPSQWHAKTWWQVVGVVVAVASVVIGVLQLLATPDEDSKASLQATVAPSHSGTDVEQSRPTASGPDPSRPPPLSAPSAAAGTIHWQGSLTLKEVEQTTTDLDTNPPESTKVDADGDLTAGGSNAMESEEGEVSNFAGGSRIAEWAGEGEPDFAACRERAVAGGSEQVRGVRKGGQLCIQTTLGRIAYLRITRVLPFEGFDAEATIWNGT